MTVAAAHFLHRICDREINKEILKQPQPQNYRPNCFHNLFFWPESVRLVQPSRHSDLAGGAGKEARKRVSPDS